MTITSEACADLNMDPKITVIVVGKRHHVRYVSHLSIELYLGIEMVIDSSLNRNATQTRVEIARLGRSSIVKLLILPNSISIFSLTVDSWVPAGLPIIQYVFHLIK